MTVDSAIALPRRVLLWSLPVLALVAVAISGYLLWLGKDAAAGCGNAALLDCESVLASRWSQWLLVPVSLPAMLLYGGVLASSLWLIFDKREHSQRYALNSLLALTTLAGAAGVWFVGLQLFSLEGFCPYCLAVHACGLTLAGLSILLAVWEGTATLAKPLVASLLGLLILIGGQIAVAPKTIQVQEGVDLAELPEVDLSSPEAALPDPNDDKISLGESFDQPDLDFLKIPDEKTPTDTKSTTPETTAAETASKDSPDKTARTGVNIAFLDQLGDPEDESFNLPSETDDGSSEPGFVAGSEDGNSNPMRVVARRMDSFLLDAPAAVDGKIELFGGRMKLNLDDVIVLGSPKASHVVVELFDYSCHHCRQLHWRMEQVRRRYGDQLAVIMLPVPLNAGCNSAVKETSASHVNACLYARLAIAVWQKRRSQFPEFHARLMEGTDLPEPGQMRYEAGRLLGPKELEEALLSEDIDKQLKIGIVLYKVCRMGNIPKLILGEAIATGKFDNTDELFGLFESKMGLKPLGTE